MSMKDSSPPSSRRFSPRAFVGFVLCLASAGLTILSLAAGPPGRAADSGTNAARDSAAAPQIRQGNYRGVPVTYTIKDNKAIFQGDIILEKVDPMILHTPRSVGVDSFSIAYSPIPVAPGWQSIPDSLCHRSLARQSHQSQYRLAQFNSTFPNIQFVARTTQTDYVNFYFDPNDNNAQCEATVGRAGGQQQVGGAGGSVNPCAVGTCCTKWDTLSASGMSKPVPTGTPTSRSTTVTSSKAPCSDFDQIYDNAQQTTLFDYASIMEYPAFTFTRNGGPVIETIPAGIPLSNPTGYSAADIDGIQRLYGSAPTAITVTSNPPGLQVIVDGATVTTPQVYSNWTLNSTHTLDIPAGVQSQSGFIGNEPQPTTFYYTYGRWNDSTAAAHSITILPATVHLATPVTSPAVTTYSANFIQLVPYSASVFPLGAGTVSPSPAPQSLSRFPLVFYTARQQATLTATPNAGQNFYAFINAPFWLPGGLSANPKTFYVPDNGLTVNTLAEFSPNPVYTVNVAPNSFSSNLYIYADGGFSYAPRNFSAFYDSSWTSGSTHTLSVDSVQYPYSSNSRYAFASWSDGTSAGPGAVFVTLPATSTTYTANLTPQFFVS